MATMEKAQSRVLCTLGRECGSVRLEQMVQLGRWETTPER